MNDTLKTVLLLGSAFMLILPAVSFLVAVFDTDPGDYMVSDSARIADSLAALDSLDTLPDPVSIMAAQQSAIDSLQQMLRQATQQNLDLSNSIVTAGETRDAEESAFFEKKTKDMAKIYDKMAPEEAAIILDGLDMRVSISVISKMNKRQAAKILEAMDPARAVQLSKKMATQLH